MRLKSNNHLKNISKRGRVKKTLKKDINSTYPSGPVIIGFLCFVIVGAAVFQIFKSNLF